jgi:hypothetical protein
LLACAAGAGALVAAESALRVLRERPPIESEWIMITPGMLDDETVFLPPRLRDDEHYAIDSALPTLVTVGDSFTVGFPAAPHDSYPSVLDALLDERGRPMNVVNMGVGNTGPDQHLRTFERELLPRTKPDIVVWQFFSNDLRDNVNKAAYVLDGGQLVPVRSTDHWIHRRQRFFDRVPFNQALTIHSHVFRYLIRTFERRQTALVPAEFAADPEGWGLEKIRLEVERMNELSRTHGFRIYYVLVVPQILYLDEGDRSDEHARKFIRTHERLARLLESEIGFIDADFRASGRTDLFVGADRDPLKIGSRHMSEAGYRELAALVLARLERDGLDVARERASGRARAATRHELGELVATSERRDESHR